MLFRCVLLLFFYHIWIVFNFKLMCASNRAGWTVDEQASLSPTLCDSNKLKNINVLNLTLLYFYLFVRMQFVSGICCYSFSSWYICVISRFESQKCVKTPHLQHDRPCLNCMDCFTIITPNMYFLTAFAANK